jgi:tetratricopeptide (TPR) repeat protein
LYFSKFIFPWRLASAYNWVNPAFSFRHVLLPLLIDLAVVALMIYMGLLIRRRLSKSKYRAYLFFSAWAGLGLLPYLQIIPLDMTAAENWFYFSMAGLMGMIGIAIGLLHVRPNWLLLALALLIVVLGVRTSIRGLDWKNANTIAFKDIASSPNDYMADKNIALYYYEQGNYNKAELYATRSVDLFPSAAGYNTLGQALAALGNYSGAAQAFTTGMKYNGIVQLYENMSALTAGYGSPAANNQFLTKAAAMFPQNPEIWFYLAIQEYRDNDLSAAKAAISQAYNYSSDSTTVSGGTISIIYSRIMNNLPLDVTYRPIPNNQ